MKRHLIIATNNFHKVREITDILDSLELIIHTLKEFPEIPPVIEDGDSLEANALKKAREIHAATEFLSLADDTGLEVDYLNGQPGVYSSRFSGNAATFDSNNEKLLQMLAGVPWEKRQAQFRCVIAIVGVDLEVILDGICRGYILEEKQGHDGFGYDPVFYIPEFKQTFAEMPLTLKNEISHRGRALQKVKEYFQNSA
jgi:XTP/dITP diphosphohydrolase